MTLPMDPDNVPIEGIHPDGTETFMSVCMAPDCDKHAYVAHFALRCGCTQTQTTCLIGHRGLISLLRHTGAHDQRPAERD